MPPTELSRRSLLRIGMIGAGALAMPSLAAACSSDSTTDTAATTSTVPDPMDELLAKAKSDGSLNLIAISDAEESAYGPLLDEFGKFSGLKLNLTEPLAGSGMELDTVREQKGKATQPDVIDVGMSYAVTAADEGLLVRSLPDGWTDVPSAVKDADGLWVSSYYGLMGIVSNPAKLDGADAPGTPDDLKNLPEGVKVTLPGDPRTTEAAGPLASAASFAAVWTVALALGGSFDDIGPGIDFFAELADAGTFDVSKLGITETMASGDVAVTMLNNFDFARTVALMTKDGGDAPEMRIIPADTRYPSFYAQCAVADSPHPNAAKLWLAYLLSEQGAKAFLQGGAVPTRFPALYKSGALTEADLGKIGDLGISAADLAELTVPIPTQVDAAQKLVNDRWGPDVKGE